MKPSKTLLPWFGVALAAMACLVSVYALGRTYVLSTNISANNSTLQTRSTPSTSSSYPSILDPRQPTTTQSRGPIVIPDDLSRLGFTSSDCVQEYLQLETSVLLLQGCGDLGGTLWEYTPATTTLKKRQVRYDFNAGGQSADQRVQLVLGPADSDGEVRKLLVKNFVEDTERTVGLLPKSLSYTKTISEYYGWPVGGIDWQENISATAYVEIYDANVPLEQPGDWRQPVLKRPISL